MTAAFDLLLLPFRGVAPIWGLLFISLLSGVLFLIIYGRCSNQRKLAEVKRAITAAIYEAILFRRDFGLCLRAQGRMLGLACRYLSLAVPPLIVLAIPGLLILAQLNLRYDARSLRQGEHVVLKVETKDAKLLNQLALELPSGIQSTPPLRIAAKREAWWRIDVAGAVSQEARLRLGALELKKRVAINEATVQPLPTRNVSSWWDWALYPGESVMDPQAGLINLSIAYPKAIYRVLGMEMHWIVIFLVVSLAGGLAAAKVLHIEV